MKPLIPALRIAPMGVVPRLPSPAPVSARLLSTDAPGGAPGPQETIPGTRIPVFRTVAAVRAWRRGQLLARRSVGLVPTMGALHAGHLALVRAAARDTHAVVVSVFLNPAQFGAREDLASYPVTWDADAAALARLDGALADQAQAQADGGGGRVAAVFAPPTSELYPSGFPGQEPDSAGSFVTITPVGGLLEGRSRPTFFRGVATVCMKLFHAVQPDRAYFGQKDVQQTVVVRRMVRDFCVPTRIVVEPTEREPDGLALSSRNVYLGARRRRVATVLSRALRAAADVFRAGERGRGAILGAANHVTASTLAEEERKPEAKRVRFEVDYISLSDPDTMEEVEVADPDRGAILSGAIKMLPVEQPQDGEDLGHSNGPAVRLIDNIILEPPGTRTA